MDNNRSNLMSLLSIKMDVDNKGLVCIHGDESILDNNKEIIEKFLNHIIKLYHHHDGHKNLMMPNVYRHDRVDAIMQIGEDYYAYIVGSLNVYRDNQDDVNTYFRLKGVITYCNSYTDKFESELGNFSKRMRYLCNNVNTSIDIMHESRLWNINHSSNNYAQAMSEKTKELNDKMFNLTKVTIFMMILSIAVAFFSGSILADSFDDISKRNITIVAAIVLIITLAIYFSYGKIKCLFNFSRESD